MSKPIVAGEIVEITAIHKESHWYEDRKELIGSQVKLLLIHTAVGLNQPWKYIQFEQEYENEPNQDRSIYGVKIRRVKK